MILMFRLEGRKETLTFGVEADYLFGLVTVYASVLVIPRSTPFPIGYRVYSLTREAV